MFCANVLALLFSVSVFAASPSNDRVWISRPDGSLQCDDSIVQKGRDLIAEANAQLKKKGVHVIESKKRNDGQVRAQMCGISTGNETSFLIPKKEFKKAKALGFVEVSE